MSAWMRLLRGIFGFLIPIAVRPRVLLFLVIFVLGVGGIGIWIPLIRLWSGFEVSAIDVFRNFATYVIAIVVTSFAEFLLRKPEGDDRTLTLFLFGVLFAGALPAIVILLLESLAVARACAWVSAIATLWLWLIALADSPAFEEEDARATMGGAL